MTDKMRVKLDRTMCDGFGICAKHAPEYFSLDDWGYAVLVGDGYIPKRDRDAVQRALLDCPVHAIIGLGERRLPGAPPPALSEPDLENMKTEANEAESGVSR